MINWMLVGTFSLLGLIGIGLGTTIQRLRAKSFDDNVLRVIKELGGKSYGVPIRIRLSEIYNDVSLARVYNALDRLVLRGYLTSQYAELTAYDRVFRSGRRRKEYSLTDKGEHYLAEKLKNAPHPNIGHAGEIG